MRRGIKMAAEYQPMVELLHVRKAYGKNELFTDCNLRISRGEICGLVGPNGRGKSVLLKMICGLARPDGGEIRVDGKRLEKGRFPEKLGVVLDTSGFLPDETGLRNLELLAAIRKTVSKDRLREVMRTVGLDPDLGTKTEKYSLGMKQRLAMAQALMEEPELLILDEPFEAVDAEGAANLIGLLKDWNREKGVTILLTSHNNRDILALCGRIYRIEDKGLRIVGEEDLA